MDNVWGEPRRFNHYCSGRRYHVPSLSYGGCHCLRHGEHKGGEFCDLKVVPASVLSIFARNRRYHVHTACFYLVSRRAGTLMRLKTCNRQHISPFGSRTLYSIADQKYKLASSQQVSDPTRDPSCVLPSGGREFSVLLRCSGWEDCTFACSAAELEDRRWF